MRREQPSLRRPCGGTHPAAAGGDGHAAVHGVRRRGGGGARARRRGAAGRRRLQLRHVRGRVRVPEFWQAPQDPFLLATPLFFCNTSELADGERRGPVADEKVPKDASRRELFSDAAPPIRSSPSALADVTRRKVAIKSIRARGRVPELWSASATRTAYGMRGLGSAGGSSPFPFSLSRHRRRHAHTRATGMPSAMLRWSLAASTTSTAYGMRAWGSAGGSSTRSPAAPSPSPTDPEARDILV